MTQHQVRRRLVTTFGLGIRNQELNIYEYKPVHYKLSGQFQGESACVPHVQSALAELLNVSSIGGVCTKKVFEEWIEKTVPFNRCLADRLGVESQLWSNFSDKKVIPSNHPFPLVHIQQVSDGQNEAEHYELFNRYVELLSHEPISYLGETEPPDEIIVDLTHGFRIQPIISLAATLFVLQDWQRHSNVAFPKIKLMYGAFAAGTGTEKVVAPIWDMTSFLDIQRITQVLGNMMRYGVGDSLDTVFSNPHDNSDPQWIHEIMVSIQNVVQDLQYLRTLDLSTKSAPNLFQALSNRPFVGNLEEKWKMLEPTFVELQDWAHELSLLDHSGAAHPLERLHSEAGFEFMQRLANRYSSFGNVPATLAIIREGTVTKSVVDRGKTHEDRSSYPPSKEIGKTRNTVLHAQLDQAGITATDIRQTLKPMLNHFLEQKIEDKCKTLDISDKTLFIGTKQESSDLHNLLQSKECSIQLSSEFEFQWKLAKSILKNTSRVSYGAIRKWLTEYREFSTVPVLLGPSIYRSVDLFLALTCALSKRGFGSIYVAIDNDGTTEIQKLTTSPAIIFDA